jgi:DNA invertase Pin-like site-specific DNA recombinase
MGTERSAFYYRRSTDRQEDSIERQQSQAKSYAARQGYEPAGEYADEGIAGDLFDKRPGFQKLLRDAAAGKFDVIVVDEPSRLSRQDSIDLIEMVIAPLRRAGVRIDTASRGPIDYESLAGQIMMTVHAHESQEEVLNKSRRTLGGVALRAMRGIWFGFMAPFGLRVVRDVEPATGKVLSRQCVLGPDEEVRAVRFIFDAIANRGWTLRRVCRELEVRGVKPPKGNGRGANKSEGRWNPATVRKMLLNRKYVGDLPYNETHRGKYHRLAGGEVIRNGRVNRRVNRNAVADVIVAPDVIPAIIDRDTFARAAAALARAQKNTSPRADAHYLFTHLLVCGDCGGYMRGMPCHGKKTYICGKYKEYGQTASGCHHNSVNEAALFGDLLAAIKDEILNPARLDAVEAEMERRLEAERASGEAERLGQRIQVLDRDIAQGNANLARLPEDRLAGVVAQVRQWEGERAGLKARLGELGGGDSQGKAILAEARKQLWRLRDALDDGDEEAQAVVVREVVSRVEIRFAREQTHGRRGATGKGRTLSRPTAAVLYARPGLGLSELITSSSPGRARGGGGRHARTPPPACPAPG